MQGVFSNDHQNLQLFSSEFEMIGFTVSRCSELWQTYPVVVKFPFGFSQQNWWFSQHQFLQTLVPQTPQFLRRFIKESSSFKTILKLQLLSIYNENMQDRQDKLPPCPGTLPSSMPWVFQCQEGALYTHTKYFLLWFCIGYGESVMN